MEENELEAENQQVEDLAKLRKSESRFRSLVERMSDAVFCWEFDPPIRTDMPGEAQIGMMYESRLAECNDVCARLYGARRAEDLVGKKLKEIFSSSPASLDQLFEALLDGVYRVVDGEGSELLDDGTRRYFLNNGYGVVEDGALVRVWGTYRDVTEHKRAERLLKTEHDLVTRLVTMPDLKDRLQLLTETAIEACGMDCGGVYLVGSMSQDLDLAFQVRLPPRFIEEASHCAANSASGRLVLSGRPVYAGYDDLGVPMDRERKQEGLRAFAIVPILHDGHVIACLNVCSLSLDQVPRFARTILESIAALAGGSIARACQLGELRQQQANLEGLLNSLEDLVFVLDMEGTILQLNETAVRRLGYSEDELLGESVVMIHPANRRRETAEVIASIAAGKTDWHPVPLMTKDGSLVAVETRVVHGSWNNGEALFAVSSELSRRRQSAERSRAAGGEQK